MPACNPPSPTPRLCVRMGEQRGHTKRARASHTLCGGSQMWDKHCATLDRSKKTSRVREHDAKGFRDWGASARTLDDLRASPGQQTFAHLFGQSNPRAERVPTSSARPGSHAVMLMAVKYPQKFTCGRTTCGRDVGSVISVDQGRSNRSPDAPRSRIDTSQHAGSVQPHLHQTVESEVAVRRWQVRFRCCGWRADAP